MRGMMYGVGIVTVLDLRDTIQLIRGRAGRHTIGMHDAGLVAVFSIRIASHTIVVVCDRCHAV